MEKIWLGSYDKGVPENIDIPKNIPITHFFDEAVKKFPENPAIIYFGRKISYAELDNLVNRFFNVLQELRIRKGDRIALHLPNIPQFIISYLAILKYGAIAVPINPTYSGKDLEHILTDSGAKVVITITKFLKEVEKACPVRNQRFSNGVKENTKIQHIIVTNVKDYLPGPTRILFTIAKEWREGHLLIKKTKGVLVFKELMKKSSSSPSYPRWNYRQIAILQYTGGTTGRPKGVMLTHRNLVANTLQIKTWMPELEEGKEIGAALLPFFHIYALSAILNTCLATSSTIVLFPQPDIKLLIKSIKKHKITILPGVPLLYERMLENPLIKKVKSLKFCVSGADALKPETQKRFEEITGTKLVEGYGLTESSPVTHINPVRNDRISNGVNPLCGKRKRGSIGLPVSSTLAKIIDLETGEELGIGQIGELAVSGPQVMLGYWQDHAATRQVIKNSWLLTGDIGYYDNEGYFYIVDRKKDMIQVKGSGLKIYPSEVEEIISRLDFVKEVVVAGIKDKKDQEVPVAFVILKEGTIVSENLKLRIKKTCEENLGSYKVPRRIEFVDEIPKTIIGKPLRRVLRDN